MRQLQKEIHIHIKIRLARYTNLSLSKNQKFKSPQTSVVMETGASPRKRTNGLHSELVLQYSSHHTHARGFRKKKSKKGISKVVSIHVTKAYRMRQRRETLLINLGTIWRLVGNFTLRPLHPCERPPGAH